MRARQFNIPVVGKKNTIIPIGDSVSQHDKVTSGDPSIQSDRGILTWTNYLLGQRLRVLNYPSTDGSGQTSTTILARLASEVLAYKPGYTWIEWGINDISGGASASTIVSNWLSAIEMCRNADVVPILCTIMPGSYINSVAKANAWHEANSRLRQIGYTNRDVIVVNLDYPYVDAYSTTYPSATAGYTVDGIHQNNLGAYTLALQAYNDLKDIIPPIHLPWVYHDTATATGDSVIWPNPLNENFIAVDANDIGVTGTKPDGVRVRCFSSSTANAATSTSVARADNVPGNWLEVAFTGAATYTFPNDYARVSLMAGSSLGGLVPGTDYAVWMMEFEMDASPTNFLGMKLVFDWWSGSTQPSREVLSTSLSSVALPNGVQSGVLMTHPMLIPADATALSPQLYVYPSAANAAFTFRVGRSAVRKYYED